VEEDRTVSQGATTQAAATTPDDLIASAFPIGEPSAASWREQALTRAAELRTLASWARAETDEPDPVADALAAGIMGHLDTVRDAGSRRARRARRTGADVERVMTNLDAAEIDLLRLAPYSWARAQMPSILAHVRRHLDERDPRRLQVEQIAARALTSALTPADRGMVIAAARAASSEQRRGVHRVRSLRNILAVAIAMLVFGAVAFAVVGLAQPTWIPLCFNPEGAVVCPTSETVLPLDATRAEIDATLRSTTSRIDIPLIELVGLIAAAVAAATALGGLRQTTGAYDFPLMLAVLKLPTGALTAVLGLLLMRAGFVPGLSALDSSAQIIAWAVLLGYSQQLFTRVVDKSTQSVLAEVSATVRPTDGGNPPPGPDRPLPPSPPAPEPEPKAG
jgi:hypothetical protein